MTRTEFTTLFQINIEKVINSKRYIDIQDIHVALWRTFKSFNYLDIFEILEKKDCKLPITINFYIRKNKNDFERASIELVNKGMYNIAINTYYSDSRMEQLNSLYHEFRHMLQDIIDVKNSWTSTNNSTISSSPEELYSSDSEVDARKAERLSYTHEHNRLTLFDKNLSFFQS